MKSVMKTGMWLFFCTWMSSCGNTTATDPTSAALQQKTSTSTSIASPVIPAAGLQIGNVGDTSIALTWTAASDTVTPANQLTYLAYYTSQAPDATSTLTEEQVAASWAVVGTATAGLTSVTVTGLSPDTVYYFTVLVSNAAGGTALYVAKAQKTSAVPTTSTVTASTTTTQITAGPGPTVTLRTPSSTGITVAGSSTILFTYVASAAGGTTLTGTLNAAGGGITTTALTGDPSCTVTVSSITAAGGSILLSSCTGNGIITVHVNAGTAEDASQNPSVISLESDGVLIDNTAPTLVSLTPSTSIVNPTPTTVIASFSKAISPVSAAVFTLGGTCTTAPTKGAVQMSTDKTTATLSLSGGTCTNGQTLTVSINAADINDLIGNIGSGGISTATYTVSTVGPSASLGTPSSTRIKSSATSSIALTYTASSSGGTALTGDLTAGGGGVTVTTVSGNPSCTVGVSGITVSGATISLSSCSGNGTLTVHANAGTVKDRLSNMSTASPESSIITVDNTAPTVSSTSPSTGSAIFAIPSSITVNFSEAVNASAGSFSLSTSTCDTPPTVGTISGTGTSAIEVNISGGTCTGSESLALVSTLSGITDLAGNAGSGTNTVTLSFAKRIFFTSGTHNGNFATGFSNWRAGADAFCTSDSNKPSTGTYKALMTDGSTRLACTSSFCASGGTGEHVNWVLSPNTVYTRPDGTVIGTTTSAGVFGSGSGFTLTNSIWTVGFSANSHVWTGFDMDQRNWIYRSGAVCSGWTTSSSGTNGCYGTDSDANDNAFDYYMEGCNVTNHLYCVEQ